MFYGIIMYIISDGDAMEQGIEYVNFRIKELQEMQQKVRQEYLTIINNTDIHIDTRWEFFKNSPDEFKDHDSYQYNLNTFEKNSGRFSWYDDFNIEKYETCKLVDIVERLQEQVASCDGKKFRNDLVLAFYEDTELFNELKEEILADNMGSFKYDW